MDDLGPQCIDRGHFSMLPIAFHLGRRSSGTRETVLGIFLGSVDKIKCESGGIINKGVLGTLCTAS